MTGKKEMPLGVSLLLQKDGKEQEPEDIDANFESVSRFKPQWSR